MVATGAQDNGVRLFPSDGSLDAAGGIPLAGHAGVRGVNGVTSLCATGAELVSSGKDGILPPPPAPRPPTVYRLGFLGVFQMTVHTGQLSGANRAQLPHFDVF